jgi:CHRD domain/PEP-CTERM motif
VQHEAQDAVDAEPGVPEAGCVVLIDLPIERRRWESLVNAFIFVIDAVMLLLTSWIAQGLGSVWTNSSRRFSGIISVVSFVLRRDALTRTP